MMRVFRKTAAIALAVTMMATAASAAPTLTIKLGGFDVAYLGSDLVDAGSVFGGLLDPTESDPLTSVEFLLDSTSLGTFTTNVYADFGQFANPGSIPVGGGTATWALPGFIDIFSSTLGWSLQLNLASMTVTTGGSPALTATAVVAGIFAQNLPFDLEVASPITLALAMSSLSNVTSSGGFVTGFSASGTGEITAAAVPEPASLLLLGTGVAALARRRLRRPRRIGGL